MDTRNIFIDTSIFIGQNYNYRGSVFESIARLSKAGQANIFLSDITISEIEAHIEADISKAIQASSKFKKDARVLRNIDKTPFSELFQDIDDAAAIGAVKQQLTDFISDTNANVLSTSEVSIDVVFNNYFNKRPPFGEGKKKSEFPDAFVIEALEMFCNENKEKMYVASSDPDLNKYCDSSDNLIGIEKLAEFISLVEFHDEVLAPAIRELVDNNKDVVEKAITESFLNEGFWIDDQDGDVNEVRVNSLEITDMLLLEVDQNFAIVQLDVNTSFQADLTYDDLATASYDSEDKVPIPWQTIDETVEQDVNYTVTLHISHDVEEPEYFEIDRLEIDTNGKFGFSVSSGEDEWPYK